MSRIGRLRESLEEPLLVTTPANVFYLTGFDSSNAALLVEPERTRLFSDSRYIEAARSLDGVEVVETKRALFASLADLLEGRIGFEADAVTYTAHATLAAGELELVPRRGIVEAPRAVKEPGELEHITHAAEVADAAFNDLLEEPWIGRTERDLAWRLEQHLHDRGAEAVSFSTIVAAGPNSARPHAHPGDRVLEEGQTVVVDWGCTIGGYCSDCTRTVSTGELPDELSRAYDACLEGQQAAVDGLRPGLTGVEGDRIARERIDAAGFGDAFGHGLGHGVGILVHEAPRLSTESGDTLEPGNVVTIEPGIYLPGLGGIRIEDLAVVREGGVDVLTSVTKELLTVR
jgi:Xaa-Pro aminopeptidase